ncbi:MAG: hypothetical protein NT069_33410 [Planctomycetota bacterium]|nr:hypothetical protein [Planctomycetota bacterium]
MDNTTRSETVNYRCEATSLEGFVQQLASNILPHGYWFYVSGRVPTGKDPRAIDYKLIAKYGIDLSRQQRARRKATGAANLHYLRLGRHWILLATCGHHRFFDEEQENIRDARKVPIQIGGYSLSVKRGNFLKREEGEENPVADGRLRVRVQIGRERYKELRDYFVSIACHTSAERLSQQLFLVAYEPYAPIRRQLLNILRLVNERRREAGYSGLPPKVLRYRRNIVKPFE